MLKFVLDIISSFVMSVCPGFIGHSFLDKYKQNKEGDHDVGSDS